MLPEKFRITQNRSPEGFETFTIVQEACGAAARFREFAIQASRLLEMRAYLAWFEALQITESDLARSVSALRLVAGRLHGGESVSLPV